MDIYPKLTDEMLENLELYTWSVSGHGIYYGRLNGKVYARPLFTMEEMQEKISNIQELIA